MAGGFWSGMASGAGMGATVFGAPGAVLFGLLGGAVGGISSLFGGAAQDLERINQIDNDIADIDYELDSLLSQKNATMDQRDTNAQFASILQPVSNSKAYDEISQLNMQAEQAVSKTRQGVAVSGFRNTKGTTPQIAVEATEAMTEKAKARAEQQVSLAVASSYMDVANNYFDADTRLRAYQATMKQLNAKRDVLEEEKKDLETMTFEEGFLKFFS